MTTTRTRPARRRADARQLVAALQLVADLAADLRRRQYRVAGGPDTLAALTFIAGQWREMIWGELTGFPAAAVRELADELRATLRRA